MSHKWDATHKWFLKVEITKYFCENTRIQILEREGNQQADYWQY